mgnify:CR=1 FL=1
MSVGTFSLRLPVAAADIDELGHVNNIVYLRYAQEIAIAHWRSRATPEMLSKYVWVVLRHEADYRSALTLGDEADVRTHVADQAVGPAWVRYVDIYKAGAAKPAVQIKSNWCLLDAVTRRVKRVPPEIVQRFRD